jgi:hypothetical protein
MDERDDYADTSLPPSWHPPFGLLVVLVFFLLTSAFVLVVMFLTGERPVR